MTLMGNNNYTNSFQNGSKVIRTADLFKKEKEYYLNRQKELDKKYQAVSV